MATQVGQQYCVPMQLSFEADLSYPISISKAAFVPFLTGSNIMFGVCTGLASFLGTRFESEIFRSTWILLMSLDTVSRCDPSQTLEDVP